MESNSQDVDADDVITRLHKPLLLLLLLFY